MDNRNRSTIKRVMAVLLCAFIFVAFEPDYSLALGEESGAAKAAAAPAATPPTFAKTPRVIDAGFASVTLRIVAVWHSTAPLSATDKNFFNVFDFFIV